MPQSIPKGLTRGSVLTALADLDAPIEHTLGAPTGHVLVHDGQDYPPKAVIGLACRSLLGRVLLPEEFSGGEAPGQANFVLRDLGFVVEKKDGGTRIKVVEETRADSRMWSRVEGDPTPADYFAMLRAGLTGQHYRKADHNRALQPFLDGRSKSSIEFTHQNISAVLVGMGLPYIDGYKPARNYQRAVLPQASEDYLIRHPEILDELANGVVLNPVEAPGIVDRTVEDYFEDRPERITVPPGDEKPWLSRRGKKIDFARRDATNRLLGELGEQFAIEVERRRLLLYGRDELAAKVEWVATTCGDGVGFDVLSFDEDDGTEQSIEVRTTGLGKHFPFYVTLNEVRRSEDCSEQFRLYRVFDFAKVSRRAGATP